MVTSKEGEPARTVLFTEQTEGGDLAKRLRECLLRLQPFLGFSIKVVERSGSSLKGKFPLNNLWEGTKCPRKDCITCTQQAEFLPTCTRRNVLYENTCVLCNPGAGDKKDKGENTTKYPSVYVGESTRSIYERSLEHHKGQKKKDEDNHMVKHMTVHHQSEDKPQFIMKPIKYFRTALSRQVAEAVRIRRRGGEDNVLNSKAEYNRCTVSRLTIQHCEPPPT